MPAEPAPVSRPTSGAPEGPPPSVRVLARGIAAKSVPLYLSMLATMAGGMVTAAVLGNSGTAELAAHALVIAVFNPALMVVQGALRGSMPFIAENEDDPASLAPVVRNSLWLALSLGAFGGLLVATAPSWGRLIGVAAPTLAALGPYPLLVGLFVVVASVRASATVLLIGLGHNRSVLVLSLVGTALVVVLTPALVLGTGPVPPLGLAGAGVSLLVEGTVTLVLALYVSRRTTVLRGHRVGPGLPHCAGVGEIARVGLPSGSTLLIKFGALSLLALAVARIGAADAAAHQLLVVIATFVFVPAIAAGQSCVPFVARAAGRGSRTEVRRSVLAGYAVAVPLVAASVALVWAAAGPFAGLLTGDPEVASAVTALLPVLCAVVVADALQSLPGMGLLGLKDPRPSMYTFAVCYGLLALVSVPLAEAGGLDLLWCAYAVATAGLAVGQGAAFLRSSARV
ncbi:MATE family efflux transporter [Nocardiopsis sp. CT-R113]|uniref:Probable multidrug resistance protein NorM n=1 Tax=Nocardiopsis codii TaxID=3065942 RepID=A0ABU7K3K1_9ACTN|nr:MATE family efflux transporter [Nocardiopsis sp. CT-R113]MEE2036813.1 MATE family efflux transporter [Nocardiopsis sp. CT-R113]